MNAQGVSARSDYCAGAGQVLIVLALYRLHI
jgi:hypothetical protein